MSTDKVEETTKNLQAEVVLVETGDETAPVVEPPITSNLGSDPLGDLPSDDGLPEEGFDSFGDEESDEEDDVVTPAPPPPSAPAAIFFPDRAKQIADAAASLQSQGILSPEAAKLLARDLSAVEESPVTTPEPVILVPTSVINVTLDPFGEAEEDEGDLAADFGVPPVQTARTAQTSQPIPLTAAPAAAAFTAPATQTQQPIAQPVQTAPAPPTAPLPNNSAQVPPVNPLPPSPPASMFGGINIPQNQDTTKSFWSIVGIVAGIAALLLVIFLLVLQVKGPRVFPDVTTASTPAITTDDVSAALENLKAEGALDVLKKADGRLEIIKEGNSLTLNFQSKTQLDALAPTSRPTLDQVRTNIIESVQDRAGNWGNPIADLQGKVEGLDKRVAGIETRLDGQDLKLDAILQKLNRPVLDPINPGQVFWPTK